MRLMNSVTGPPSDQWSFVSKATALIWAEPNPVQTKGRTVHDVNRARVSPWASTLTMISIIVMEVYQQGLSSWGASERENSHWIRHSLARVVFSILVFPLHSCSVFTWLHNLGGSSLLLVHQVSCFPTCFPFSLSCKPHICRFAQ